MKYPYGRHNLSKEDRESVMEVLNSDFITQGSVTPLFEKEICEYINCKYAIAVSSATAALHLSCITLGINKNSIVWTSSISFVATANAALYCQAEVKFIDINLETGNLDLEELEKNLKKAKVNNSLPDLLIVVHMAGSPLDMEKILSLKKEYKFSVIEDASHAFGAEYFGIKVGSCSYSEISVFSFHPVKMITTGEGGAITTNNKNFYEKAKLLRSHGIEKDPMKMKEDPIGNWKYEQQYLGFNYRIADINTALGISQLKRIENIIQKRRYLVGLYNSIFIDFPYGKVLNEIKNTKSSYHLALFRINSIKTIEQYKNIFDSLRSQGIGVQLHYYPIHLQYFYKQFGWQKGDLPSSEKYARTTISIPLYESLEEKDIMIISKIIKATLKDILEP